MALRTATEIQANTWKRYIANFALDFWGYVVIFPQFVFIVETEDKFTV